MKSGNKSKDNRRDSSRSLHWSSEQLRETIRETVCVVFPVGAHIHERAPLARRGVPRGAGAAAPWRQVTRGIAGDDLSRRAITAPNTVARVSERQFLADDEAMALASRRQKMILDERRAREAAEKARVEAMESENTPPKPALDVSEDTLRNVLLAVAAVAAGAGLYAS